MQTLREWLATWRSVGGAQYCSARLLHADWKNNAGGLPRNEVPETYPFGSAGGIGNLWFCAQSLN